MRLFMTACTLVVAGVSSTFVWQAPFGAPLRPVAASTGFSDTTGVVREYVLESSMIGYYRKDGTRNPVLKANRGDRMIIRIVNAELMPHDVSLEKHGVQSATILDKGASASVSFIAKENDTYYCSIPGHREAGMLGSVQVVEGTIGATEVLIGENAVLNGRRLNLNFESGDLTDWTAEGDAFASPVLDKDPSPWHEKDVALGMTGNFFVSSGGLLHYKRTGTLTSVAFPVAFPFASFKVSGGALQDTRVEILNAEDNSVIFKITGSGRTVFQPVVVDLAGYLGKRIKIRLVDNESGISSIPYIGDNKKAHLNFDDFQFHKERPQFENELKPSDIIALPPLDQIRFAGLSGIEAAKSMTVPDGFKVTLGAAEPDVIRPIAFTQDARNRLWVVEGHTYPVKAPEGKGRDRILILEDTDGDGSLDSKKVFVEGLNLVSGIELGMGGVWIGAAPELLFIPVDFATDKPAGPARVMLDGWGYQDTHETLNSLRWGPDGWLYGTHGVFTHSNVGVPGTPDLQRTKLNGGVWRFHPTRHTFEVFSEGFSNPWGLDFNDLGHAFTTACVIPHMYNAIQGGRFQRQAHAHFNPYTYDDIKTIGDHVHWEGNLGPHAGNFRSAAKGGGHAHSGAMIYLADTWPQAFRSQVFMNNINGARFNTDQLVPQGSGYKASHLPDFIEMNDTWSQWLNFRYDAGGSVWVIDWYDKNQCHSPNPDVHDKTLGRIFKLSYKDDVFKRVDLYKASNSELIQYQLHANEWYVRQARLLLQERGLSQSDRKELRAILAKNPQVTRRLRALWVLNATQSLTEQDLLKLLTDQDEHIRSWATQLSAEKRVVSPKMLRQLAKNAAGEASAEARLYLASALQRIPVEDRWDIIAPLLGRNEDTADHNLPLMLWYALEPMVAEAPDRAVKLARNSAFDRILPFTIRRVAALKTPESKSLLTSLRQSLEADGHKYHASLDEIKKALEGK